MQPNEFKSLQIMSSQKKSLPSFASIISVLSIVLYGVGFLRVEFELNEQRKRIYALENIEETEPSDAPNINKIVRNAGGKLVFNMVQ